ncbi:hypothetical protein [Salinicola avicenniae]|uniref:hypothetical protein n=1 Tax=Salinicola avicenniae TaxID=2916836 RepID=UPI002073F6FC|nr:MULTISPECIES: hypothetical protein [unclassified Salinicola]
MHINTARDGIVHYRKNGHSQSSGRREVVSSKPDATKLECYSVSDTVMDRLKLSSAVGKTIDRLCYKGNQKESIYATKGESTRRLDIVRDNGLGGDFSRNKVFGGNCGELSAYSEHILAAINNERASWNRRHRHETKKDVMPVTVASWEGDHTFTVLGDPRERPMSEVVTVDGWVMRPSAHTMDHSAFEGGFLYRSSTVREHSSYLDERVGRRDIDGLEKEFLGSIQSDRKRTKFNKELLEDYRSERFHVFDHDYADADDDIVIQYRSPSQSAIGFDHQSARKSREKERIQHELSQYGLDQALNGPYG